MQLQPMAGGERDRVAELRELFADLPDSMWTEEVVRPGLWDDALLDPVRDILSRSGKGFRGHLVEHAWRIGGGDPHAIPSLLPVVIELLHVGSLIVDDIQDDSALRRGAMTLHRRYGLPIALNTANWLYFVAMSALSRADLPPEVRLALSEEVSDALMRCHEGQALDLSVRVTEVRREDVARLVATSTRLKTGSLMRFAARLGVRAAGAPDDLVELMSWIGSEIGIGLQMLDDWSGLASTARIDKGREDIRLARLTWPWAWLAEDTDDLTYRETTRQAREASLDWQVDRVIDRMRALLAPTASGRVRGQLDTALRGLDDLDGTTDGVELLAQEVARLRQAYA